MTTEEIRILQDRLDEVMRSRSLGHGAHKGLDDGMCVMEAVAYVAGRPWSDSPPCVCPVIATFMRNWNDSLPTDADRDRLLKPLIPALIGTKASDRLSERRSYMALDWLVRVHTPKWLDLVPALKSHALALRDLDEIADMAGAVAAGKKMDAARDAAGDAAWAAAGDAAGDAAWAAAWAAAGDAAWAAARAAARAAAGAAAWDAAGDAAWAAAGDAAWAAALKPTTEWLQASAQDLVKRMCALSEFQPYFQRAA